MDAKLHQIKQITSAALQISGSKSETNRLLLLQKLYPNITILNHSYSDDSVFMQRALASDSELIDVEHAGTAMRFLTAFYATQHQKEVVLTGSERMQERPIYLLVEALTKIGADITYLGQEGYPPLKIKGVADFETKIKIDSSVSSQYISALLLIAPKLEKGLEVELVGIRTSAPYIDMTVALLRRIGVKVVVDANVIKVFPCQDVEKQEVVVESDWSSASYWYSIVAQSQAGASVRLSSYRKDSLQGDFKLVDLYRNLGVETHFEKDSILLVKNPALEIAEIEVNMINTPDLAQTLLLTCVGMNKPCSIKGLHTLKIKETDRLVALQKEISKLGEFLFITNDSLSYTPSKARKSVEFIVIDTYQDHRMAMAFAPLALHYNLIIKDMDVVSKSYPNFWNDFKFVGFDVEVI